MNIYENNNEIKNKEYPFLSEEEDSKIVTLICNYLSLGQFELARALILQISNNNNSTSGNINRELTSKISSILYHTIRNGPPSTWLTSETISSSPHLSWLCSIEFYQLNQEGFKSSISEKTLLLLEFSILVYSLLGELQNNDRNIQPIIQELREYHYVLLTQRQSNEEFIDTLSTSQLSQMDNILLKSRLNNSTISILKNILLNNSEFGRHLIKHFTNPFISLDQSYSLLQSKYPVTTQLEQLLYEVILQLINQQQFNQVYNLLSIIDLSNNNDSDNNIQQQNNNNNNNNESDIISKLLEKISILNIKNLNNNINIEELTLLKIPFNQNLTNDQEKEISDSSGGENGGESISRLKIYESLLSNRTLDPLKQFLKHEESILVEPKDPKDFPQVFEILLNYFNLKPSSTNINNESDNNNNINNSKVLKNNLKLFNRDDQNYQDRESIFWYWYYHFLRVNNHHYLEYSLMKAIELVKDKRFEEALVVIKPFEKLLPLLILLCWDHFENDITSRKSLTNLLDLSKGNNGEISKIIVKEDKGDGNTDEEEQEEKEVEKNYTSDNRFDPILLHSNHQLSYLIELAEWSCRRMIAVPNSPNGQSLIVGNKVFDLQNEKAKRSLGGSFSPSSYSSSNINTSNRAIDNSGSNSPPTSLFSLVGRSMTTDISNEILNQLFQHSFIYVIKDCLPFITSSDILKFIEKDPDYPTSYNSSNNNSSSSSSSNNNKVEEQEQFLSRIALEKLNDMNLIRGYYLIKNILKFFQYRITSLESNINKVEFDSVLDDVFDLFKGISNLNISVGLIESLYLSLFLSNQDLKNNLSTSSSSIKVNNNNNSNSNNVSGNNNKEFSQYYKRILNISSDDGSNQQQQQQYQSILLQQESNVLPIINNNQLNENDQLLNLIDNEFNYEKQSKTSHKNYLITSTMLESLIEKLLLILNFIETSFNQQRQKQNFGESIKERIEIIKLNLENLKLRVDLSNWILNFGDNSFGFIPFMSLVLMPTKSLLLMAMRTNYPNFETLIKYFTVPKEIENQVYQYQSIPNLIETLSNSSTNTNNILNFVDNNNQERFKGINDNNIFQILCDIVIGSNCQDSLIKKVLEINNQYHGNNSNCRSYINWVSSLHKEYLMKSSTLNNNSINISSSSGSVNSDNNLFNILINPQSIPEKDYQYIDKMKQYINNKTIIIKSLNKLIKCYSSSSSSSNNESPEEQVKLIIENDNGISTNQILSTTFNYILTVNKIYQESNSIDYSSLFNNINQSPKQIIQDIVFNQKDYKKAEVLSNFMQIDLSDLIISSISHTVPKNPSQSLFKSTTPDNSVLNSPIYYINNDDQQQEINNSNNNNNYVDESLKLDSNIEEQIIKFNQENEKILNKNILTMDLVNYIGKSSLLLSSLICMLKSPSSDNIDSFLNYSIENSKQLSPSISNWINEILKAHTFYNKYFSNNSSDSNSLQDFKLIQNSESIHQQQNFFFKIIQYFVNSGNLYEALKVADEYLEEGAPDWLLKLLVFKDKSQGYKYIRRMRDKSKALNLVMELYNYWDIAICIDMIVICKSFLQSSNQQSNSSELSLNGIKYSELDYLNQSFILYQSILNIQQDNNNNGSNNNNNIQFNNWQSIKEICQNNPIVMVRSLLDTGHYELARKIRDHFNVSGIKKEIEERYLYYLLVEKDDTSLALQTLSELGQEAIVILESLLPTIKEISIKLFLVQFLLSSNMRNHLSSEKLDELVKQEMGYQVLMVLPNDLQVEYLQFVNYPNLIIEMLIMNEKIPLVSKLLVEVKELRDIDDLLTYYARKALSFGRYLAKNDLMMLNDYLENEFDEPTKQQQAGSRKSFLSNISIINHIQTTVQNVTKSSLSSSSSNPPSNNNSIDNYDEILKLNFGPNALQSSLSNENLALSNDSISSIGSNGNNQSNNEINISKKSIILKDKQQQKWILTCNDSVEDEKIRHSHFFPRSPSISLAKSLFDLCLSKKKVYNTCIELYGTLSKLLSSTYSDDNLLIINLIQQLLMYTKLQLLRDPKSGGPTLVAVCDTYLGKVELFQSLVISKCSGSMSLVDLSDPQKVRQLRDRLIQEDRLKLAIDVAKKCNIPADSAWVAWGISLIQTGSYIEAREKFKYCLTPSGPDRRVMSPSNTLSPDTIDSGVILNQIIQLLESPPSPNHSNFRNLYNYLVSTQSTTSGNKLINNSIKIDDNLFYSLLQPQSNNNNNNTNNINTLSNNNNSSNNSNPIAGFFSSLSNDKKSSSSSSSSSTSSASSLILNNIELDSTRLNEAIYYLKKYGNGRMLVSFLIKHNLYRKACELILSDSLHSNIFFEEVVMKAISNSSLQSLFNTIKEIDPKLLAFQDHLLASCKIMNERKQYQLLYDFQLYMGDYVRAGLTCVKIFISNPELSSQTRIQYLEQANNNFNLGLSNYVKGCVLSEYEIEKYIQNIQTQLEISKFFYKQSSITNSSPIHKITIFGTPKQKMDLVENLTIFGNFELGFKITQEFKLPLPSIYINAFVTMARKKMTSKIEEYLNNLRTFISPDDWDSIAMPVIETLAVELKEPKTAEKLIPKIYQVHNNVRAHILCGKLKSAYLTAVQQKDRSLILLVLEESKRTNQPNIQKWCEEILNLNQN